MHGDAVLIEFSPDMAAKISRESFDNRCTTTSRRLL